MSRGSSTVEGYELSEMLEHLQSKPLHKRQGVLFSPSEEILVSESDSELNSRAFGYRSAKGCHPCLKK